MEARGLTDWRAPWLEVWQGPGARVAQAWSANTPLHEALNREQAAPVHFVPQSALPAGTAYE